MWVPLRAPRGCAVGGVLWKLNDEGPILTGWNLRSGLSSKNWLSSEAGEASRRSTAEASIPSLRGPPGEKPNAVEPGRPRGPEICLQGSTLSKRGRRGRSGFVSKVLGEWLAPLRREFFKPPSPALRGCSEFPSLLILPPSQPPSPGPLGNYKEVKLNYTRRVYFVFFCCCCCQLWCN